MALIRDLPAAQLPSLLRWTFDTLADRDVEVVTAGDVGRFAYVEDTQSFHILIAVSPATRWVAWYSEPTLQTPVVTSVSVTPATVTLSGATSQQFTANVVGTNLPSQNVTWTATSGSVGPSGLWTAPAATVGAQTVTVTATSATDGTKFGSAVATVSAAATDPEISLSSVALTFATAEGGADPAPQTIAISNTGGGTLAQATLSAITYGSGAAWLAIAVDGATVTVTPTLGALTEATYTASFTVISAGASNTPVTVNVSFGVAAAASEMLIDLGTNLDQVASDGPAKMSADLVWSARPWAVGQGNGDTVSDWVGTYSGTSLDSHGWPIVPTNQVFGAVFERNPWVGVYKLSFHNKGAGTGDTVTSYSGNITLTNRAHDAGTNVTTYDVTVPSYVAGQFIWLRWAGTTGGIDDVTLMRPLKDASGWHAVGTPLSDHIIDRIANFSTIRTMMTTGGYSGRTTGYDSAWAGRTKPWSVQTRSADAGRHNGVAWENIIAMANQAQKDVWIAIPFNATDDYILQLARCFAFGSDGTTPYTAVEGSPVFAPLDAGLNLYVEHGNEIWNQWSVTNYNANNTEITAGDPNRTTYTSGSAWEYAYRRVGWLAVRQSLIFRGVFGADMMTRVRPVLATQHASYATIAQPLNYIGSVWGAASIYDTVGGVANPKQPVSYYLYALATAPYIPDGNDAITDPSSAAGMLTGTLANLALTAAGRVLPAMTYYSGLATTAGVAYIAYEGGNNLIPSLMPGGATTTAIQNSKDANYDATLGAAMGAAITGGVPDADQSGFVYGTLFKEWKARGGGLFCHYTLAYIAGSGGTWGMGPPASDSGSDPRVETGPKWDAVKAFNGG